MKINYKLCENNLILFLFNYNISTYKFQHLIKWFIQMHPKTIIRISNLLGLTIYICSSGGSV